MKLTVMLILICSGLLTSCCNSMGGVGCASQYSCSSGASFPSCQCADPGCTGNACLSAARCCSVYGNIGGGGYEDNASDNWDATYSLGTSSYDDNYTYSYSQPVMYK